MSDKLRLPLPVARKIGEAIAAELAPYCAQIEIAGSIRRGRAYCGDLDLVVLPKAGDSIRPLLDRCARNARAVKHGDQYCVFELRNGWQLDLWIAHPGTVSEPTLLEPEPQPIDPPNFGALLLARTGSAMHNVFIAQQAQAKGLHFNPSRGITRGGRDGRVIASESESAIFTAIGLPWIAPENRER